MIDKLLLLGATGDLAGRFLFPALTALRAHGRLADLQIVGAAPDDLDDDSFRRHVDEQLDRHANEQPRSVRDDLLRSLSFARIDLDRPDTLARAIDAAAPLCVYLALPPHLFPKTIDALITIGLPRGSRVAIEKPFGVDLAGARSLNTALDRLAGGDGGVVFRIDHVLGMPTLDNLLGIRLANPFFEPLWNAAHIEEVNVLWEETIALEGRAGFYDKTGALKDVGQNHMLQILSLVVMEPPAWSAANEVAARKVDALRAIGHLTDEDVMTRTSRARYGPGRLAKSGGADGSEVPGYADEEGVDPARGTETFIDVSLELQNERWNGTRFRLRAGKALSARRKGVEVLFRPGAFSDANPGRSLLWIGVDGPTNVTLQRPDGNIGPPPDLTPVGLLGENRDPGLPAYAHVLSDILGGGSSLSVRGDEAEEAWRVLTPVIDGWARGLVPLNEYPAGSAGP